ncbi:MAG: hypothetical protein CBC48_07165 [bacterium TMED88]|nr:MAG: hypothetical protein CBC48_07165 [bacterium TMED88]
MVTRKALFEQFSYNNGDSFYIAHNNASFCTAFQLIESLVGLPMTLSFEMGSILNIAKQAKKGILRSSDLAFKPSELFPSIYLKNKLKALEIEIDHEDLPSKTYLVPANRQIRQVLSEYLRWPVLKQLIIAKVLNYEVVEENMFTVVGTEYVQQQTGIPYRIRKDNRTNDLIENNLMLFEAAGGKPDSEVLMALRAHLKRNKFDPKPKPKKKTPKKKIKPKKKTPKKKIKPKSPTTILPDSTNTTTTQNNGTTPNKLKQKNKKDGETKSGDDNEFDAETKQVDVFDDEEGDLFPNSVNMLDGIPAYTEIEGIIKDARQQLKVYEKDVTPRKVWKDIFKNKCTFDALQSKIAFKQYILQQHKYEPYQRVQYADIADVLKNCTI